MLQLNGIVFLLLLRIINSCGYMSEAPMLYVMICRFVRDRSEAGSQENKGKSKRDLQRSIQ